MMFSWRHPMQVFLLMIAGAILMPAASLATPENPPPEGETRLSLFDHAHELAHAGDHEAALTAYDSLLAWVPDDPEGRLGRGRVLAWMGKYPLAEKDILFVTTNHPTNADAWSAQADLYRWWQKPEKSLHACNAWLALEPDNPDVYITRARAYMLSREFPNARSDLQTALKMGGDRETINRLLVQLDRVPPATKWEAALWYEYETQHGLPENTGHHLRASIRRRFDRGSITYGLKWLKKFDNHDEGLFVDFYHELWERAYANVRFELAAAPLVMPLTDTYLALYQGFGTRYEVMASFRHMDYNGNVITVSTAGIGMFTGQYYLRTQFYVIPKGEVFGRGLKFSARRYLGIVDNFVEASIVRYRDFQLVDSGYLGFDPSGWILSLHAQKWISKTWGLGLGYELIMSDEPFEPNRKFWRFGLFARW
jgi:YaiO family outer membrane protein